MGLMGRIFSLFFGDGRNVIAQTAEVFRENAENSAQREANVKQSAMRQFSAEFSSPTKGWFDRMMDGLNRLPRPLLAYGTIGLFVTAMVDPIWFASRMQGIALVPEPLWWLMGAIVSFYFGARYQTHSQDFQRSIVQTMARVPQVIENTMALEELRFNSMGMSKTGTDTGLAETALSPSNNPALDAWRRADS